MPDRDMLAGLDLERVEDAGARECIRRLLNLVEELAAELEEARAEIQRLRDENNRLRGEQGKPTIRAQTPKTLPGNHSSEHERRQPKTWTKGSKKETLRIDRAEVLSVDPAVLPPDAEFKGYADVVVQDLVLRADVILFRKAVYGCSALHPYRRRRGKPIGRRCRRATRESSGRGSRRWRWPCRSVPTSARLRSGSCSAVLG